MLESLVGFLALCAAQCLNATVQIANVAKGTIQRGFFFNGVGLQAYAPGQNCLWQITFTRQMMITFTFDILALGYDDLDYIEVMKPAGVLVKKLTGFGKNIVVNATGNDFGLRFFTTGSRSPYPLSAGFIMRYITTRASLILTLACDVLVSRSRTNALVVVVYIVQSIEMMCRSAYLVNFSSSSPSVACFRYRSASIDLNV